MKRLLLFFPLLLLVVIVGLLLMQLRQPDAVSPSEDWRGKPFPEFHLPSLLDNQAMLSRESLPNKPFIVNVWASWCTWCIKEFPQLQRLQQQGVPIVGLTYVDKPQAARQALQQWGNPFVFVIDDSQHDFLIRTLNINASPTSYLVDKNGIIRYQQAGYNPKFDQHLIQKLQELEKE